MACTRIKSGFLCVVGNSVDMEPFGEKIWMRWHNYLGPTFYRSKSMIKPIINPSRKTWKAFDAWKSTQPNDY